MQAVARAADECDVVRRRAPKHPGRGLDRVARADHHLLGQMEVTKKMIRSYESGVGLVGPFGHMIDLDTDGMVYG